MNQLAYAHTRRCESTSDLLDIFVSENLGETGLFLVVGNDVVLGVLNIVKHVLYKRLEGVYVQKTALQGSNVLELLMWYTFQFWRD